jgi:DNA-binding transcriptional regulator YhcF (GntR family)
MSLPDHRSHVRTADEHRAYIQLADQIREQILDGQLGAGQQIPSIKKLCLNSGFSRQTIGRSLRLLDRERLITRIPGRGYYVCSQSDEPQADAASCPPALPASVLAGDLTAERSDTVSLLVRELARGNPLVVAWLDLADTMLNARCPQCAGPMTP